MCVWECVTHHFAGQESVLLSDDEKTYSASHESRAQQSHDLFLSLPIQIHSIHLHTHTKYINICHNNNIYIFFRQYIFQIHVVNHMH